MHVLELERVQKSFIPGFLPRRRRVLHDISFSTREGEVFGFLGPNGAGKTTTIKLIVGLLRPDSGRVLLRGIPAQEPAARRSLGFLPENPYFYDYLTGAEFLDFYGRLLGLDQATRRQRARALLERLQLHQSADVALRRYSKGMVQRLGFAQALLGEPSLLVLDEPMSGLDPAGRRLFRDLIVEQRQRGCTVFFSSHILQDAELICDRVAIIADGRVRRVGPVAELLAETASSYEVELDGDIDRLGVDTAAVVTRSATSALVRAGDLEAAEALVDRARQAGLRVRAMIPSRATLEDAFLREVGSGGSPS